MSAYDERPRRYHDTREARYAEPGDGYYRTTEEIVPRSSRVEEMSVEPYREHDVRRSRNPGPYYEDEEYYGSRYADPRDYDRALERRKPKKATSKYYLEEQQSRRRVLGKEQKIMAALAGAALFAGGKELVDRHKAEEEGEPIHRNPLASAALGAAGALAGYQGAEIYNKKASKHKSKHVVRGRDGHIVEEYWTDESSDDESDKHNNNFLKNAITAAGIGKFMKGLAGAGGDDRSVRSHRSRSVQSRGSRRSRSLSSSRSRSRSESNIEKIQKAAMASLLAGASEAFRVAKQPGSWKGEKTKRVLTAAAAGGAIDAAHDTNHTKLGLLESVMGGLVGTRALLGSKKDIYEDKYGRSRSRSRAPSSHSRSGSKGPGLAGAAAAALAAVGGKKLIDSATDRSRSRGRHRDDSVSSRDSRRSRGSFRERSRSRVRQLLAKTGLRDAEDSQEEYSDGEYHEEPRRSHRHRRHDSRSRSRSRSVHSTRPRGGGGYSSESDANSEDEAKEYKKMRGSRRHRHH